MNIRIFNAAVLAIALFSVFSGFAVVTYGPRFSIEEPEIKAKELIAISNTTSRPVFISGIVVTPIQVNPGSYLTIDATNIWNHNLDPVTAADFPDVMEYTLSKTIAGVPFGTTRILINGETEKARAILNIGSYNRTYNFDFSLLEDLAFSTTLMDDLTKPAGNFENVSFELLSIREIPGARPKILGKIFSEEENLQEEKMRSEQKRLLKMPETRLTPETIMQLPSFGRR
jgi:hypothetical protein